MKKLLILPAAILACAAVSLSLFGCGRKVISENRTASAETRTGTTEPFSVFDTTGKNSGRVSDVSQKDDKGAVGEIVSDAGRFVSDVADDVSEGISEGISDISDR